MFSAYTKVLRFDSSILTNALSCTLTSKFRKSEALSNRLDPDVQDTNVASGAIRVVTSNLKPCYFLYTNDFQRKTTIFLI